MPNTFDETFAELKRSLKPAPPPQPARQVWLGWALFLLALPAIIDGFLNTPSSFNGVTGESTAYERLP